MRPIPDRDLIARGTHRGRLMARGFRRRCPRCGAGELFDGLFDIRDPCPRCHLVFEREEGHWLGAMIIAFAVDRAFLPAPDQLEPPPPGRGTRDAPA